MHGILIAGSILGTGHSVMGNEATGNVAADLSDGWGDCTHNGWRGNTLSTSDPPCIR